MNAPFTLGLFSQVVMQSGTGLCPWAVDGSFNYNPTSMEFAVALGCIRFDTGSETSVFGNNSRNFNSLALNSGLMDSLVDC